MIFGSLEQNLYSAIKPSDETLGQGLNYGTEYNYHVTTVNGVEESDKSTEVKAKTQSEKKCFADSNYNHVVAGRATHKLGYWYANGSNENMGLYNILVKTKLCETDDNYFVIE